MSAVSVHPSGVVLLLGVESLLTPRRTALSLLLLWWACVVALPQGLAGLGQLPALSRHYVEHRADDQELSWLSFLLLHYGDPEHQAAEDHSALVLSTQSVGAGVGLHESSAAPRLNLEQPPLQRYWVAQQIGRPSGEGRGLFRPPMS